MEYQKLTKLLDTTFDNVPRYITKNGLKFMISQVVMKMDTNQVKKQDLDQIYVILVMRILLLKEQLLLQIPMMQIIKIN